MKCIFLFCFFCMSGLCFAGAGGAFSLKNFKNIIQRYKLSSGVTMNFDKETTLALLKKTKLSKGFVFLSGAKVALEVKDSLNTRILFDGKSLWYTAFPPGGKKQVMKISDKEKGWNKALLSLLFRPEVFFQEFRFVSSRPKGRTWLLDFEPKTSAEIKTFSLKVDGTRLLKLWILWRSTGNKEVYTFSNIRFNQKISARRFKPRAH